MLVSPLAEISACKEAGPALQIVLYIKCNPVLPHYTKRRQFVRFQDADGAFFALMRGIFFFNFRLNILIKKFLISGKDEKIAGGCAM